MNSRAALSAHCRLPNINVREVRVYVYMYICDRFARALDFLEVTWNQFRIAVGGGRRESSCGATTTTTTMTTFCVRLVSLQGEMGEREFSQCSAR